MTKMFYWSMFKSNAINIGYILWSFSLSILLLVSGTVVINEIKETSSVSIKTNRFVYRNV